MLQLLFGNVVSHFIGYETLHCMKQFSELLAAVESTNVCPGAVLNKLVLHWFLVRCTYFHYTFMFKDARYCVINCSGTKIALATHVMVRSYAESVKLPSVLRIL